MSRKVLLDSVVAIFFKDLPIRELGMPTLNRKLQRWQNLKFA
jgi:hypothetical protein